MAIPSQSTSMKNGYAYRFTVFFENGERKEYQRSGFKTKKAAEAAKEETIVALVQKLLYHLI